MHHSRIIATTLATVGLALAATAVPAQADSVPTPQGLCGSGYYVQRSHDLGAGVTAYQLYNGSRNCAVSIKSINRDKRTHLGAYLQVAGREVLVDEGNLFSYAGPLTALAAGKCVRFGGIQGSSPPWYSTFANCG
jgi:hypothetical protein